MPPIRAKRSKDSSLEDKAAFLQGLPNLLSSFIGLGLSLVVRLDGDQTWMALVPGSIHPGLVQFEGYLGGLERRQRYHVASIDKARRKKAAFIGSYGGAHDAFVPVLREGRVEGVLVSGPFFGEVPTAQGMAENLAALSGRDIALSTPLLAEYGRVASHAPVMDAAVQKGFLQALNICAAVLAGEADARWASDELTRLEEKVFAARLPWRSWLFSAARRDRRFYEFHVQPKLMPWDKRELGLEHYPSLALAIGLRHDSARTVEEIEEVALNAALQHEVFRLSREMPDFVSGRLDSTGALLLFSPPARTTGLRRRQWTREVADALASKLRRRFHCDVGVGIGSLDGTPERLPETIHEASVALHLGARTKRGLVFFDEQDLANDEGSLRRLYERFAALHDAYANALVEEGALAADQFVAEVLLASRQSTEAMRLHFLHAFQALLGSLRARSLLPAHRLGQFSDHWFGRLESAASQPGLISAFREMLAAVLGLTTEPGEGDRQLRLEQARRYLDQHFAEVGSIEEVAKVGGFSPSRFSRLFRRAAGKGFAEYLLERRLERASHLLLHSRLPVQQVAIDAGFSSLSYFSQAFKRATGKTPSAFRGQSQPGA